MKGMTEVLINRRSFVSVSIATAVHAAGVMCLRSEDAQKTRVAVIGHTGRGDYGHGIDKVWLRVPQAEIVAVADPDDAGRAKALKRLHVEASGGYSDYREMLSVVKPDVVAIGPRHVDQHRDMAVAAAESGAQGIYIEKPFCRDLAEADAVVQACEKSGTRLAIAHRNRYHPVLPVIKALLEEGAIGKFLEIRVRGKEDQRGGALDLWVLGSHLLNLADYFAGPAVSCSAALLQDARPVNKADVVEGAEGIGLLAGNEVHARFDTKSGVQVFFDSVKGAGTREAGFGLQLIGNEGVIDIRADKEPLAHIRKGNPFLPKPATQPWIAITSAGIGKKEPITDIRAQVGGHLAPAEDLLAAIREKREPLCSAKDGQVLVEMIMAVFESHRLAGQTVALPLKNRAQNPLANLS